MAKYRTLLVGHEQHRLLNHSDHQLRYFTTNTEAVANMDYDKKVKKFTFKKGDTLQKIIWPKAIVAIFEDTKDLNEAMQKVFKSKFAFSFFNRYTKTRTWAMFDNTKHQFVTMHYADHNTKEGAEQLKSFNNIKAVQAAADKITVACERNFNYLSVVSRNKMTAEKRKEFIKAVAKHKALVEHYKSQFPGIELQIKEFNIDEAPVKVTVNGKKKVVKKGKKKISGTEEIGAIPLLALLIVGALVVVVAGVTYYEKKRMEEETKLNKIKEGFDKQHKNNQLAFEIAKAVQAGTISQDQGKAMIDELKKQNDETQEGVIDPNADPKKKNIFDDIQKTALVVGGVVVSYLIVKNKK